MRFLLAFLCAAACLEPAQDVFTGGPALDTRIEEAIAAGEIPGAVCVVGHGGRIVYEKAYGSRALLPEREPMTLDTIFDAASLTKVLATTSSLMKLVEQGRIRINDPVTAYLPEFEGGHSAITVRNLLTHFSGLRPDLDLQPAWSGYDTGVRLALAEQPVVPPGTRFIYSDINFILLGEIVHRVGGAMLSEFALNNVFLPAGMRETRFQPAAADLRRTAPTEIDPDTGQPLRGVVHDETARFMGGVAGHAGVFTTAADLARFAQMMLDGGQAGGRRVFSSLAVREFTSPQSPADQPVLRGLGWDIDSPFSGNRGELFPIGSYGHTGFTGTSMWIDPFTNSYVILLTNSVHPHRGTAITSLRSMVATIAAASFGIDTAEVKLASYEQTIVGAGLHPVVARNAQVLTGLDALAKDSFSALRGKNVGLITNHTGLTSDGRRNIDVMRSAGVNIKALFSPEHGLAGRQDQPDVANSTDPVSGLPVYSLYHGTTRRIQSEMLRGVDALVFDIQDVGARFYTYSCTLLSSMEEATKMHIPFYVLDRPNPVTGVHVEGPVLQPELESFVGCYEIPLRHGMTFGELATYANGERRLAADLHVVRMTGWQRGDWWDSTGLPWVNPSPNMRSLNAALLYPGLAMLEASRNYSVGRGTDAPFEQVGADWIEGGRLAAYLNARFIPGVRVYATRFQPSGSNFQGKMIEGVRFVITDRNAFDSTRMGIEVACALQSLYPGRIDLQANRFLLGSTDLIRWIQEGADPGTILQRMEDSVRQFVQIRQRYLLYH